MANTDQRGTKRRFATPLGPWDGPTSVTETGLSVVFEPNGVPIVDIVFVHGLQGHPFRTWAAPRLKPINPPTPERPRNGLKPGDLSSPDGKKKKTGVRSRLFGSFRPRSSALSEYVTSTSDDSDTQDKDAIPVDEASDDVKSDHEGTSDESPLYYWPREALPEFCPEARILTWGYDSHVTKGFNGPANKSSVYQHGKDLLYGLSRLGSAPRPMILIAHSLGGIVAKEMLALSHNSSDGRMKAVARSTAAVVFLGTPHRGSPWAKLGESASKVVSSLGLDTSSALLDALGLKNTDLQRSQEAFSAVWNNYHLRVKTFKEGQGLRGTNFGGLNDKVVDDVSSSLGDEREHAEVLNANHRDMCRFSGPRDPNLINIMAELADICSFSLDLALDKPSTSEQHQATTGERQLDAIDAARVADIQEYEILLLQSLSFPGMREACQPWNTTVDCEWLFKHTKFLKWRNRNDVSAHPILWIKGDPGSGKSTAIRVALQRLLADEQLGHLHLASFFFNSKADTDLLRSTSGLLRSLLCQLLPKNRQGMARVVARCRSRLVDNDPESIVWNQDQLVQMIQELFVDGSPRTIVLIDALDECEDHESTLRLVNSLYDLVFRDGAELSLCLTTRHLGAIPLQECEYIVAERENGPDIQHYINKTLDRYQSHDKTGFAVLKQTIKDRSRGIFLWVVLVTDHLIKDMVKGIRNTIYLEEQLYKTPKTLVELYGSLVAKTENPEMTFRVLRWAVLAKVLTLREWRYLLPFLHRPTPSSHSQCQKSEYWAKNDEDLADLICHLSMGLVRVLQDPASYSPSVGTGSKGGKPQYDQFSLGGRAGSLDSEQGDTRLVSVIHRSVGEFFEKSNELDALVEGQEVGIGIGHLDIMHTCLDLIAVPDLNELVDARIQEGPPVPLKSYSDCSAERSPRGRSDSVRSFTSASTKGSLQNPRPKDDGSQNELSRYLSTLEQKPRPKDDGYQNELSLYLSTLEQKPSENDQRQFRLQLFLDYEDKAISTSPAKKGLVNDPGSSRQSVDGHTVRVLREYPDIINYALSGLSFHAMEAQKYGVLPGGIMWRLLRDDEKLWQRWLCLNEDRPYNTPLKDWAMDEGLGTWVDHLEHEERISNMQPIGDAQYHYTDTSNALFIKPCTEGEIEFYKAAAALHTEFEEWIPLYHGAVGLKETTKTLRGTISAAWRIADILSKGHKSLPHSFSDSISILASTPLRFHQAANVPNVFTPGLDANARKQALVLGNATFGFRRPNVLTVELGPHTTTPATATKLGFRITGMNVHRWCQGVRGYRYNLDRSLLDSMTQKQITGTLWEFLTSDSAGVGEGFQLAKEASYAFSRDLKRLLRVLEREKAIAGPANLMLVYDIIPHGQDPFLYPNSIKYCAKLFGFSHARWCDPRDGRVRQKEDVSVGMAELVDLLDELSSTT